MLRKHNDANFFFLFINIKLQMQSCFIVFYFHFSGVIELVIEHLKYDIL